MRFVLAQADVLWRASWGWLSGHWTAVPPVLVALISLGGLIWRKGARGAWRWFAGIFTAGESRRSMHKKVDQILREMHPNRGASMRDSIDGMGVTLRDIRKRQSLLSARVLSVLEENDGAMWEAPESSRSRQTLEERW